MNISVDPEELFEIIEKIGEGSYGCVYKARHRSSNKIVAIKVVSIDDEADVFMKEISILKECKSDFIVKYYSYYVKDKQLWIVMEYCGGGSLRELMVKGKMALKETEIKYVISEMLICLVYMHEQKKIHRDIKSGNILLTDNAVAKLSDFGVSAQMDCTLAKRQTVVGTPYWMAPEVLLENFYDCKADIWSLGITAMELAEGNPPHCNVPPMKVIFLIPNQPPPRLQNESKWSKEFVDFVNSCLIKNPENRPTSQQLCEHPFVASTIKKLCVTRGRSNTMKALLQRLRESRKRREEKKNSVKAVKAVHYGELERDEKLQTPPLENPPQVSSPAKRSKSPHNRSSLHLAVPVEYLAKQQMEYLALQPEEPPSEAVSPSRKLRHQGISPPPLDISKNPEVEKKGDGMASPLRSHEGSENIIVPPHSSVSNSLSPLTQKALDELVNSSMPALPAQRPTKAGNVGDWTRMRQKGLYMSSQFKKDMEMLIANYQDEMNSIIGVMNSYLYLCLFNKHANHVSSSCN